jgi:hypothetical protein
MPRQFDRLLIEAVTQCRPPLRQQRVKYLRLRNVGVSLHRPRDGTPLPADTVVEVVNDMRAAFNGSRVREYVLLFVERRARAALTELAV